MSAVLLRRDFFENCIVEVRRGAAPIDKLILAGYLLPPICPSPSESLHLYLKVSLSQLGD